MFYRSASFVLIALPILASAASHRHSAPPGITNSCNTGSLLCCNDLQDSKNLDLGVSELLALLHIDINSITGKVGVSCSPITVIGTSGTSCTGQPACCIDNDFSGILATGCTPSVINT